MESGERKIPWKLCSTIFAIATVVMVLTLCFHLNTLYVEDNVDYFYPHGEDEAPATLTWNEHCSSGVPEGVHPASPRGLLDCDEMYTKTYDYLAKILISIGLLVICFSQRNQQD